jgi:hypothetical protein
MLNEAGFIVTTRSVPVRLLTPGDDLNLPNLQIDIDHITWKGYELLESLSNT